MFVDKYQNGDVGYGWAGTPNHAMVGKFENMKFEFFARVSGIF